MDAGLVPISGRYLSFGDKRFAQPSKYARGDRLPAILDKQPMAATR